MSRPRVLRMGVCNCVRRYHGKFGGRRLRVGQQTFVLQEIGIPEEKQLSSLQRARCHLLLDSHRSNYQPNYWTGLFLNDFIAWGGSIPYFWVGFIRTGGKDINQGYYWRTEKPITSELVLNKIEEVLEVLEKKDMKKWLARMSFKNQKPR